MPGAERDLEIYLDSMEEGNTEAVRPINELTEEEAVKFLEEIPFKNN
ncbi:MAG: hypothetical protein ABRQ39_04240 [Candidatus Eremiobacterota bacterium]